MNIQQHAERAEATAVIGERASNVRRIWSSARHGFRRIGPPRVFLYSHDTYGLGHLRRNLAIAEHLLSRRSAFSVRLLTGSPVIGSWAVPEGLDVTALPPVVKTGVETYAPRDSALPFSLVKAYREALILKMVIDEAPDIFLVDHAPAGMNAELLSTLAFMREEMPETQVILGLRDILDSGETVRRIWAEQGIIALIDTFYDRVLVYGASEIMDVVEEYGIPPAIAERLSYCGYVARAPKPVERADSGKPLIVVTAGGGEDGHVLMETFLTALARLPSGCARALLVTGPLMSDARRDALRAQASGDHQIEIVTSTTDLPAIFARSDLIVAMGGYNTSVEIVASGKPAILVPRAAPRAEQRLRAAKLARLGLVWSVEPGAGLEGRLADQIARNLAGERLQKSAHTLDLDGATRVGDLLESLTVPMVQAMVANV